MNEGRAGSAFLDVNFYKSKYGDLQQAYGNNNKAYYEHFVKYGIAEGRQASQSFDVKYYLSQYGDLQKAYGNNYTEAIKHYIYYGKNEGRKAISTTTSNDKPSNPNTPTEEKVISQKELSKYIKKVELTTENWQDYIDFENYEIENTNSFGEVIRTYKHSRLKLKDKIYCSQATALEFELTNNLLFWTSDTKGIVNFGSMGNTNNFEITKLQGYPLYDDVYDDRITINDIKCIRTKGYLYIFNLPNDIWQIEESKKCFKVENKDYSRGYVTYFEYDHSGTEDYFSSYIHWLGNDIENGKFKDINL